jgi:hypothetical protein
LESVGTSIDLAAISVVIFFLRSVRPVRVFMLDMLERPMRFWEYDPVPATRRSNALTWKQL